MRQVYYDGGIHGAGWYEVLGREEAWDGTRRGYSIVWSPAVPAGTVTHLDGTVETIMKSPMLYPAPRRFCYRSERAARWAHRWRSSMNRWGHVGCDTRLIRWLGKDSTIRFPRLFLARERACRWATGRRWPV